MIMREAKRSRSRELRKEQNETVRGEMECKWNCEKGVKIGDF
jgi:hypothetical protein